MARHPVLDAHRAACYPDAFRIEAVSNGVRLSLAPGVFAGWVSLPHILSNAHAEAKARGGRLEIAGSGFLRTVSRSILKAAGVVKLSGASNGTDVYLTGRKR